MPKMKMHQRVIAVCHFDFFKLIINTEERLQKAYQEQETSMN